MSGGSGGGRYPCCLKVNQLERLEVLRETLLALQTLSVTLMEPSTLQADMAEAQAVRICDLERTCNNEFLLSQELSCCY